MNKKCHGTNKNCDNSLYTPTGLEMVLSVIKYKSAAQAAGADPS